MNEFKTLEEFGNYIVEQLKRGCGDRKRVEVRNVPKNNGISLMALSVEREGGCLGPAIYIEPYYTQYRAGTMNLKEIVEDIVMVERTTPLMEQYVREDFRDFKEMKHKIVFRLINGEKNQEFLKDVPFIAWFDLAIIFSLSLGKSEAGLLTVVIHNDLLEHWNIRVEELWNLALENSQREFPSEIYSLTDFLHTMLKESLGECYDENVFDILLKTEEDVPPMYVISNISGLYGAGCILYEGVLRGLGEKLGCDLVILPSSVHEMLLTPYVPERKFEELCAMVQSINRSDVPEEDVLADSVYLYSRDRDEISKVA